MKVFKEILLVSMLFTPLVYLLLVWNNIPESVAMQWGFDGNVNRYGTKFELLLVSILLPGISYLSMTLLPLIDPKKKISSKDGKFNSLRFLIVTIISLITLYFIYIANNQSFKSTNFMLGLVGFLFIVLGNFSKTIKPNYFLGIRNPWTLESELVWKKTHKLGGVLFFLLGILIVLSSLLFPLSITNKVLTYSVLATVFILFLYSYVLFNKEQKKLK